MGYCTAPAVNASYGGYSGYGLPAMDEEQLADVQKVLKTQYKAQLDMLAKEGILAQLSSGSLHGGSFVGVTVVGAG